MSRQLGLGAERGHLHHTLWDSIPEARWLNAPSRIDYAEHKLTQLVLAHELGFTIPQTLATNDWESIHSELPEEVIFKPTRGFYFDNDELRISYTTRQKNTQTDLPTHVNPFPGIWQSYLDKAREWRITIVGDDAFDAAIYTDDEAKDDWRKLQSTDAVTFTSEDFPSDQKEKCFKYLSRMGLKFGAFDFTEDYDGEITFLECNPNGHFGWLEDQLGMPISSAIADELTKIASNI